MHFQLLPKFSENTIAVFLILTQADDKFMRKEIQKGVNESLADIQVMKI